MLVRVNKKISSRTNVKYAALHSGTISHVWHDEETDSLSKPKRKNRIRMTREKSEAATQPYDA